MTSGYYWTSTSFQYIGSSTRYMQSYIYKFTTNAVSIAEMRAQGLAVRCIKN
jgi:hypothetical protein